MSIRLNKVTRDLNVGMSTLVDFLQKKGHVVENNPNSKITDEEYDLLVKEFRQDMSLKLEAERLVHERINRDKQKVEVPSPVNDSVEEEKPVTIQIEDEFLSLRPQIKQVGKIDLDTLNKRTKSEESPDSKSTKFGKPVQEPKKAEDVPHVVEKVPTVKIETPTIEEPVKLEKESPSEKIPELIIEKPIVEPEKVVEPVQPEIPQETVVEKAPALTVKKAPIENVQKIQKPEHKKKIESVTKPIVQEGKDIKSEPELFKLGVQRLESNIKVIKTIDLDALNQSTRPKKKTQAEKRKEREEKIQIDRNQRSSHVSDSKQRPATQGTSIAKPIIGEKSESGTSSDIKKKKRNRIKDGKVRVNDSQPGSTNQRPAQSSQEIKSKLKKPVLKSEISSEDVSKQVKETLARLTSKPKKGTKYRKEKREAGAQRRMEDAERENQDNAVIKITEFVTVNDLASMMDVPVVQVISTCMSIGQMVSINQRLDAETINFVADEFGFKTEYVSAEVMEAIQVEDDAPEDLIPRPPIVTVMGHVDHGKTSLLDYIRNANVIAGEAGGITQHIGAYNVKLASGKKITFLDTPGHEAFTAMRARGAKVTDIAIIIVAADDDVMPQTIEAINHAAAANVPMVFAINKIDRPHADPEKIKKKLAEMNYLVEDWGGKYQSQDISAKKGLNVKELLEKVLLEAEMLELKANPNRKATGSIIESSLDKGRGYVATVLVDNGTLHMGDIVIAGTNHGRIKAMFNERGQRVQQAGPSEPVMILGLNGAPQAGDNFHVLDTEQEAREIANKREQLQREQGLRTNKLLTLAEIGRRIAVGNFKELNVIVKGDVDGSIEALSDSLIKLSTEEIQVNVIHKAVGAISESDVTLASASDAIIIGFQVRPSLAARRLAEKEGVDMHMYSIIYDAIEEVRSAMEGMLSPEIKEEITATIEVREVFKITKVGTVAGCMVKEGKVKRGNKLRLIRDGIVIYTGEMGALKRFKDDVKEVAFGYEFGLSFAGYQDLYVGDIVESFEEIEVRKSL
ncbi:MAG: translation initiation factor IF-2 [Bacteroidales bacterium]|nr:translation initiation factor IF-2 [Bacteroidales bacterium]